jgi:septal ring factor EnvC (AmiA/AmiB activator)
MTQKTLMNKEEIRETLDRFGIDVGEMTDDEMMDMASELHDELMENLTEDDNMSYHGDYNDDDEDDAMMENMERVEALESEMESMRSQMEEMRDMMMEEMDDMDSDMMDMESQMASLRDEKKALEKRLRQIEDEPQEPETYSESNDFAEWVDADGHISDSPNSLR